MDAGTYLTGEELKAVKDFQSLNNEELKGHMALFQYEKMMDALREAQEGLDNMVEGANDGFSRSMDQTFIYDGYKLQGSTYVKEVCEGATLMDVLREKYYVKTFKYFADYQSDFDQHLVSEDIDAKNLSFEAIQSLIGKGMSQVEEERTEIFGDPDKRDEETVYEEQSVTASEPSDPNFFESMFNSFSGKSSKETSYSAVETNIVTKDEAKSINEKIKEDNDKLRRVVEKAPGTFNSHIGYAPMLKEDASPENSLRNNVLFSGKGEMGRMMGAFMQNSIIHAAGNAEASKPMYDRKLWDDRGSPIGAPNIRTVTEIGVAIAATVATGGMGGPAILGALAVAGIGMADDLAFAALDTLHYSGRKNGNEMIGNTWSGFAKKGATSLVTSSIGAGFSAAGSTGSVLGDMAMTGAQGVYTNVASSALNSWDWQDGSFDMQGFTDGFAGEGAMAGYLASMAGTGVTGGLNQWGTNTGMGQNMNNLLGNTGLQDIYAVSSFAGNLASMGVEYGMTGSTNVNLAGFMYDDLRGGSHRQGLLSMRIGGGTDQMFNLGGAGYNMSYSRLSSVYSGMDTFGRVAGYKMGGKNNHTELETIAMNANYGTLNQATHAQNIFYGKEDLEWGNGLYGDSEYYGMLDDGTIFLNENMDAENLSDIAKIASVLGHEWSHADGNHIKALAHAEGLDTYGAMLAGLKKDGFGAEADEEWVNTIVAGMLDINNWQENSGDGPEFWRVVLDENGKVTKVLDDNDKRTFTVVDEYGRIKTHKRNDRSSFSQQIADIAALFQEGKPQDKAAINQILMDSGLDYDEDTKSWFAEDENGKYTGTGYNPVYEAVMDGRYNEIAEIVSSLGMNSDTDISQEMVEIALGLKDHTACAITSVSELNNNFLSAIYGDSFNAEDLINAIGNAQGEMFNEESWVHSWNGINAIVAAELGYDNYLIKTGEYNSLEELQAAGITYYLEKHIDVNDAAHTHFTSWSIGYWDDTDTTTDNRWWETPGLSTSVYYGFKPKN